MSPYRLMQKPPDKLILFPTAMLASRFTLFMLLAVFAVSLTGCAVIGDIFKAGAYSAIIVGVIVVLIVLFIVNKLRGPRP